MYKLKYFSVFLIVLISFQLQSQVVGGTYEKLAKLYNDGKYESCLIKAEDCTFDDKTKKDAEPYLYMSKCMLMLYNSDDVDIKVDYRNGEKQAIKYAGKFAKKDKDDELYSQNIEYINELKTIIKDNIQEFIEKENYKKVASYAKMYSQLNRESDYLLLYLQGMSEVLSNNFSQGDRNIDMAVESLSPIITDNKLKKDKIIVNLIPKVINKYLEYLVSESQNEKAGTIAEFSNKIFLGITVPAIEEPTSENEE